MSNVILKTFHSNLNEKDQVCRLAFRLEFTSLCDEHAIKQQSLGIRNIPLEVNFGSEYREATKQQPSMLPGPAVPGCCLVSFHILWAILSTSTLQGDSGGLRLGWVDLDLGSSPGWWAATVATYCPNRMVEHSKSKSTHPWPFRSWNTQ